MQFYTRIAVLCLFAGVSASALGQATNAPTSPTLTPETEKRARELLDSYGRGTPTAPTLQEREAARKRAEAEAKQRLEEQKKKQTTPALAAPAVQPPVEGDREQRERELKRIEAEVEKARKSREPAAVPQPAPRAPAAPASAPAAAEGSPLSNTLTPDAEARAREVLTQRTAEIKVNPPKPTIAVAAPVAPSRPPVATPAPAASTPVVAAPTPRPAAVPSLSAEQESAARYLLDQKTAEIRATPPAAAPKIAAPTVTAPVVVTTPPVTAPVPAPAVTTPAPAVAVTAPAVTRPAPAVTTPEPAVTTPAPAVAVTAPVVVSTPAPAAPAKPLTTEQEAAARAAMDQRMFEITGVRPGTVPPPTVKAPAVVAQPQATPHATAPRTGPASSVTAPATTPAPAPVVSAAGTTRSQKLAALLEAYRADKISPIEYHTQRAKILAETQP